MQTPTVLLGKPQMEDTFDLYKVDDINVYLKKGVQDRGNGLHVFLRKFLWVKDLAVDGMRIFI